LRGQKHYNIKILFTYAHFLPFRHTISKTLFKVI
jgi:hypothetical protein